MKCLPLLLLSLPLQPTPSLPPELTRVETLLRNENLPTDGPGLLAYLRTQTRTSGDDARLRGWIRDLGDDDFDTREQASKNLLEAGRKAIAYLRPALESRDREVVRRAASCLESITEGPLTPMMPAILRLLGQRRPEGTVAALLAFLPSAEEEAAESAIFDLLRGLGVRDGKLLPEMVSAFDAGSPLIRAVAAHVCGDLRPEAAERHLLGRLLRDPDLRVRFEAAQAVVRGGERGGIPVLIDLIRTAPPDLAYQADELLGRLAGPTVTIPHLDAALETRAGAVHAWGRWWEQTARQAGWSPPPGLEPCYGRVLVVEFDTRSSGGALCEIGRDGRPRWRLDGLKGPNDVQPLPGGRFLVAERGIDRVSEFDRSGKLHWSYRTSNSPVACQRLADGTTLVVTFNEIHLIDRDSKPLLQRRFEEGLRHGRVLPEGRLLLITAQGEIVEMTREGKELHRVQPKAYAAGASYWASVVALPGERYLAALGSSNKVVEVDRTGKVIREWDVPSPVSVLRLRNGHTLVASFEGRSVVELDREGKEIWKCTLEGRPFHALRY